MMNTFVSFIILWLVGSICEGSPGGACNHNLHCDKSECCINLGIFPVFSFIGEPRYGNCEAYKQKGAKCEEFSIRECGCMPGLECVTKGRHSFEGICKNSAKPYVEPDSGAKCDQSSDCPSNTECCVIPKVYTGFFLGDNRRGYCTWMKKEGAACTPNDDCGCAPGLDCTFPEATKDGASPKRICVMKTKE